MNNVLSNYDLLLIAISHAIELAKKGENSRAKHILNAAIELADSIEDASNRFSAFIQLARAYALIGDTAKSGELLDSICDEFEEKNSPDYALYKLVLRTEKIKLGLVKGSNSLDELEKIRNDFEDLLIKSNKRPDILRYYLAFILIFWGPEMVKIDRKLVESVLTGIVREYSNLSEDLQYAELLLFLAEIHLEMNEVERAVEELKKALKIYYRSSSDYDIKTVLDFVREKLPDKFNEILEYLRELGFKKQLVTPSES